MPEVENKTTTTVTPTPTEVQAIATPVTPSTTISEPPKVEVDKDVSALASLGLKESEEAPKETPKEEPKVETPPAPAEEYELELDDKSPLTEKDLDEVVALAQKYKWPKEVAEQYLKNREEAYSRGESTLRNKAMEIVKKQKEEFLKDPDFAGEKLTESLNTIDTVVSKYGDNGLREFLRGPGGNSLPLAKMLLKIGKIMAADDGASLTAGKGTHAKTAPVDARAEALKSMYPAFFPEA